MKVTINFSRLLLAWTYNLIIAAAFPLFSTSSLPYGVVVLIVFLIAGFFSTVIEIATSHFNKDL